MASTPVLSVNEALSGISGSISLACWIFVLVPQVWENFVTKSASSLSVAFLVVWFIGDATNFVGAVLAKLVPTVVALSIWYLIADSALIGQVLYYNYINHNKTSDTSQPNGTAATEAASAGAPDERAPLMARQSSVDVPGSRRRSSLLANPSDGGLPAPEEARKGRVRREAIKNTAAVIALFVVGAAAWALAYAIGAWEPTPTSRDGDDGTQNVLAVVLGYVSAVCYLGARVPQIIKNHRDKSCEGLSLLFFILSMAGNITYGAQIFFHSLERDYLLTNLPWLIGSIGTVGEDLMIFVQFRMYRKDTTAK